MAALKKSEVFHLIIFAAVFLYFVVLKVIGHLELSWFAMLVPLYVFAFIYILIKVIKQIHQKWCKK